MKSSNADDLSKTQIQSPQEALLRKEREVEKLLEQNRTLCAQKSELEKALGQVLQSTSWKITRPIRKAAELSDKLFPLLRFTSTRLSFASGLNTSVQDSSIEIKGGSPTITLKCERSEISKCYGWVSVEGILRSSENHAFFFLYYKTNGAFSEKQRFWLTFVDGKPLPELFYLPKGVQEFRLDPFNIEGFIDLQGLRIRHYGTLQFLWKLFRKHFGTIFSNPGLFFSKLRKAYAIFKEGGITALRIRFFSDNITNNYQEWVKQYDTLTEADCSLIRQHCKNLKIKPLISVIMPVWNTPEKWLRAAIESVRTQLYSNWELCIADDASTEAHVKKTLEEYMLLDPRIKVVFREITGHISEASNSAFATAKGDYIALLDHDDELRPHALYLVALEINKNSNAGLIYSDEDKITGYGMRINPYFKTDWNPLLLLAQNYVCHLTIIRRDIVNKIGAFRKEVQGAQDWDLILRVSEILEEKQICHIPHVLYHWRVIEGSTAQSTLFKPYVLEAQKKAVTEHLDRTGKKARVEILEAIAQLRVRFELPSPLPSISLIIPTRDQTRYLRRCLDSLTAKTTYTKFDIIVMDNGSKESETLSYLEEISKDPRITVLRDDTPFNFSKLNNEAAAQAKGDFLVFLNNDLEVINSDWLSEMLSYGAQKEVGAVGARLLYPNGLIQHAGIILGIGGVAGHNHKGQRRENPGYFNRAILPQYMSAVTAACLLIRKDVFRKINGFDEALSIAFNDVDLCLRIRNAGFKIVYTPYAEFFHYESISRGYENTPEKFARFEREIEIMKKRWHDVLQNDPYYNPNLSHLTEDFAFAFPPRVEKPWKRCP